MTLRVLGLLALVFLILQGDRLPAYAEQPDVQAKGGVAIGGHAVGNTITVINDWWPVHYGHRDDAERELAAAIAERRRAQRHRTIRAPGRAA